MNGERGKELDHYTRPASFDHVDTDTLVAHMHALAARMGVSVSLAFSVPNVAHYDWRGMKRAIVSFAHALVTEHRKQNGDADMRRVMLMLTDAIIAEVHDDPNRNN